MSKDTKDTKAAKEINKEKLKALQLTIDKLEKTYGKGAIMKMGEAAVENVEVIPTGSLGLDIALGGQGQGWGSFFFFPFFSANKSPVHTDTHTRKVA